MNVRPVPAVLTEPPALATDLAGRTRAYLHAGQIVAAGAPTAITTVLGSCVALCLHDPVARVGGVNHFVLPSSDPARPSSLRFGDEANAALLCALLELGARRERIVAKIFGGASVLRGARGDGTDLGARNVAEALRAAEAEGIRVLARDVGGDRGRRLVFLTDDGSAWVRVL